MKSKLFFVLLFALCVVSGCKKNAGSGSQSAVKNVKTVFPVLLNDVSERTFPGVVKVANEINLGFKAAGQISRILVKEGDYVHAGDVLAELDKKDYLLQLQASQIQYDQLKAEVERLEELYKRNSLSANDYEKAAAGLNALGVQLQANKNMIEYTVLKSPVSGYIQSVKYSTSEMVDAGMAVVCLIDVSSVKIEIELPTSLFLKSNDFIGYSCRTNLIRGETIPLQLIGINRKSNSSQLHKMSFVPVSSGSGLTPGMNVEVIISMREETTGKTYALPMQTAFNENGKTYVWVVRDNLVKKHEVETGGMDKTGDLIILSGVSDKDEVVKAGIRVLNENDSVNIIPEATDTNVGELL